MNIQDLRQIVIKQKELIEKADIGIRSDILD